MPFTNGGAGSASNFGVGPTKSAVMVFGPRHLPDFDVHLGGVSLPVVSSYKNLGVLLTPTLSWTKHIQLPPVVSWGSEFFAHFTSSSGPLRWCRFADGVDTFWAGLPAHPVLVYFANLDGLTLNTWRWDDSSLLGSSFSMAQGLGCPRPRHCPQCGISIPRDVGPPCTCHVCPS